MKKSLILIVALLLQSLGLYAADPVVTTNPEVVRGATLAFAFGSVDPRGNTVTEKGICWATSPYPGIEDNTVTATALSYRCRLDNLPPASRLYIRAYAKTSDNRVFYGENETFTTIPKGKVTYTVNQPAAEDIDHYNRIKASAEISVDYYNNLTSISNKHLWFNYSSGVPTADANYDGWIRFGSNASYQQVGTALHEMAHCIGVGTHGSWAGLLLKNGVYQGRRANRVLQLMTGDPKTFVRGDNTHFWPYGINGAHEDDRNEMTYIINTMLVQAMGEDGLPPSGGFATPAETFAAKAGKKYYIKSEAVEQGRDSMFLVAGTNNLLTLETMSPAQALADDRAAWYFHFDPATQYYYIRNAATGKHLGLNATQAYNGFMLMDSAQTAVEKLHVQLIRNRNDIMSGDERAWMNLSGFWIINPRGRSSQSLRAFAQTIYSYNTSLVDASSTLRWVLMDEEQTGQFDRIIRGQGVFDPDTSLVYTIKPVKVDARLKAYVTNNVHLVNLREDDQRQKWKLQAVESQEEGAKRYYLYNLGAQKCLTIQKWIGEETSTAQALRNTKMLAKDPENIHQQLSLKSVEVDFSGEVPVRYITIENDHPVMLDTVLDERAFRLEVLNESVNSQVGNRFDVDGVRDAQRWILIADQVQTALPEASVAKADLFYRDGLLHYRLPENSTLEVFTLTGQLVAKTQAGMDEGELELDKGIYMVRVRQQQGTEVFKILAH